MTFANVFVRFPAVLAAVILVSLAMPALGQGFKWWQADGVIKELGLTPEQTRRLEDIFQKAMPTLKAHKTALDAAEAQFERLIEKGDEAAMQQINVVEAARAELNKARALMLWNMRQVLTRDQWAKFTALQQAAERERARAGDRRR